MCNNILQFAHVWAWCKENGRAAVSMRFAYKYRYFRICHTPHHNFLTCAVVKFLAKLRLIPTVDFDLEDDVSLQHQDALMRSHNTMWVDGWMVRFYDLFLKYRDEIVNLFAFDEAVEASVAEIMGVAEGALADAEDGAVLRLGLHIRRGDYARFLDGRYFYDDRTYIDLVRQFRAMHPQSKIVVYVCGNDPTLDKDRYCSNIQDVRMVFPEGNPGQDLCLLSHCDWLIGAPSTFSLVAAMYRDLPLYWIRDAKTRLVPEEFQHFATLLRQIDQTFGRP